MNYFEVCITPSGFFDIFMSEIADYTGEAVEIIHNNASENGEFWAESCVGFKDSSLDCVRSTNSNENLDSSLESSIVVRSPKDREFITGLIKYLESLSAKLSEINGVCVNFSHKITQKDDKDWIKNYQNSILPVVFGSFCIYPPWHKSIDSSKIDIILEPSLAFGSGHHCSTAMCISALESCDLVGKTLLDVGCGSGILALCANKLGAKVDLCDIDELAIMESKKNFERNNAVITEIWQGSIAQSPLDSTKKYDIVVANIVASVIIELSKELQDSLKDNAYLILSGILCEYKSAVLSHFSGLELISEYQKDEWICLKLQYKRKNK